MLRPPLLVLLAVGLVSCTGSTAVTEGLRTIRADLTEQRLFVGGRDQVCVRFDDGLRCDRPRALAPGAVGVTDGIMHECQWTAAGKIFCAGYNKDGRVGNGKRSDAEPLVEIGGIEGAVVSAAAGARSTCARTKSGKAYCWGDDVSLAPVAVDGADDTVAMTSSQSEDRCFLAADGTVLWSAFSRRDLRPIAVLQDAAAIGGCARTGVCAVRFDGRVVCAVPAPNGLLDGPPRGPAPAFLAAGAVRQVVNTFSRACALRADGTVFCWDFLGAAPEPLTVAGFTGVVELGAGTRRICARRQDAAVYCALDTSATAAPVAFTSAGK